MRPVREGRANTPTTRVHAVVAGVTSLFRIPSGTVGTARVPIVRVVEGLFAEEIVPIDVARLPPELHFGGRMLANFFRRLVPGRKTHVERPS